MSNHKTAAAELQEEVFLSSVNVRSSSTDTALFVIPELLEVGRHIDEYLKRPLMQAGEALATMEASRSSNAQAAFWHNQIGSMAEAVAPTLAALASFEANAALARQNQGIVDDALAKMQVLSGLTDRWEAPIKAIAPILQRAEAESAHLKALAADHWRLSAPDLTPIAFDSPGIRTARNTEALLEALAQQRALDEHMASAQAALLSAVVAETHRVRMSVVELMDTVAELEQEASEVEARRHRQLIVVAMVAVLFGFVLSRLFGG